MFAGLARVAFEGMGLWVRCSEMPGASLTAGEGEGRGGGRAPRNSAWGKGGPLSADLHPTKMAQATCSAIGPKMAQLISEEGGRECSFCHLPLPHQFLTQGLSLGFLDF